MTSLGLRPAAADELPAWVAGTAHRLGRLRQLAGRVGAAGAQAEGAAVMALFTTGQLPEGHSVLAMVDPVAAQPVGWLWVHTIEDTRGRVAQVQHLWLEGDALPGGVTASDVMDAVERAVDGADLLKIATYTADPVLTAVVAGRGFEPDVLRLRLWLDDVGELTPTSRVRLTPMSDERFERWSADQEETYADELVRAGMVAPENARQRARESLAELLPDGLDTADNKLFAVMAGPASPELEIGVLWVTVHQGRAFVYDVLVHPEHRRRGHARAMLSSLHQSLRERGTTSVGLSVFGWNTGARALYAQLGYVPVEVLLSRRLTAGASTRHRDGESGAVLT